MVAGGREPYTAGGRVALYRARWGQWQSVVAEDAYSRVAVGSGEAGGKAERRQEAKLG